MTRLRLAAATLSAVLAGALAAGCGGGERGGGTPSARAAGKIDISPTGDARADARGYLARLCPQPIGGELNFMVWEGYTDTLFTRLFEEACGVTMNATYMGSSDDLVAKLRAGAGTFDLISLERRATAILEAGMAQPIDLARCRATAT
jgi:spermidine/putrescine-binding protein